LRAASGVIGVVLCGAASVDTVNTQKTAKKKKKKKKKILYFWFKLKKTDYH